MGGSTIVLRIGTALASLIGMGAGGGLDAMKGPYMGSGSPWRIGQRFRRNKPFRASRRHSGAAVIKRAARKAMRQ